MPSTLRRSSGKALSVKCLILMYVRVWGGQQLQTSEFANAGDRFHRSVVASLNALESSDWSR